MPGTGYGTAMVWKKSPPELVALFASVLPDDARVERRSMFGYPCAFVGGNMVTGLHEDRMIVRLPEAERDEARARGFAGFEPMPGRPMKEYLVVPAALLGDAARVRPWVARAVAYGASLPPKARKPAKAKKPAAPRPRRRS